MLANETRDARETPPLGPVVYVQVGSAPGETDGSHAARTRRRLGAAGVLAVRLVGPPGSGKTALVEETLWQLRDRLRTAAVVANPAAGRDAERLRRYCDRVQAIESALPDAESVEEAVGRINLAGVDVLLIEACGGIAPFPDVGQDETVAVLAVSGGDDKAAEYGHLVAHSSLLVLTKADLRHRVSFDSQVFRSDIARLNPSTEVMEVSAYENRGIAAWLTWIEERWAAKRMHHHEEGDAVGSEWFFG
jgi:hydrogenase nickel incorporation protein HypB